MGGSFACWRGRRDPEKRILEEGGEKRLRGRELGRELGSLDWLQREERICREERILLQGSRPAAELRFLLPFFREFYRESLEESFSGSLRRAQRETRES